MAISNKYKFYIKETSLGVLPVEVFPCSSEFSYSWAKVDGFSNLIKNIASDIELSKADFQKIMTIENANTCSAIIFTVETFCGSAWVLDFEGTVKLRNSDFDLVNCRVKLSIEPKGIESCAINNLNFKINIYESLGAKVTVKSDVGVLEFVNCTSTSVPIGIFYNDNCVQGQLPNTWAVFSTSVSNVDPTSNLVRTRWVRQTVASATSPIGAGWVQSGANWVRKPETILVSSEVSFVSGIEERTEFYRVFGANDVNKFIDYDNGIKLGDLISIYTDGTPCQYTVISDFFGINADNTHPTNIAYNAAIADYQNLIVWKTADVKRPEVLNNSSIMMLSLGELLAELKTLFNVESFIYRSGGVNFLRIEHKSYWQAIGVITPNPSDVIGWNTYTYDSATSPRQDKFYFAQFTDGVGGIFDGFPINYSEECSNPKDVRDNRCTVTMTNMGYLFNNDSIPDEGIVIAATYTNAAGEVFVKYDAALNDLMSWSKLQENFHYYDRPFATGTINGVSKTFVQEKNKIEDVKLINIGNCYVHLLNTSSAIRTKIGDGRIKSVNYDTMNCIMSLILNQ